MNGTNLTQVRSPPTTSCLEMEWDYSSRKGSDGQKKKIGKANEKRKRGKSKKEQKMRKRMDIVRC